MPNTFTLQVNRRDPRPRSPRLRSLGSGSANGSAMPGGQIPADIAQQISAAIAALTERIASAYLSKLHDDVAAGRITFEQGLSALQTVNIEAADLVITSGEDGGGNLQADGNLDVSGAAVIGGNTTIGGFTGSPSFATGLLGHGWRIGGPNNNGHGELDSLTLRRFLEVPELRFNRTEVHVGVAWQTHGAGLIEEVSHPDGFAANRGIIKLKLEDGEIGAVAVDDYCMGIFHNENPGETNASANSDQHNGNFTFAGFQTVYFKVVSFCDETGDTTNPDSRNQYFIYELRPVDATEGKAWSHQHHPQPSMSFACYANPNNAERQSCKYSTTEYEILLTGMADWTYTGSNIAYILGKLDDFTIPATRQEWDEDEKKWKEVAYNKQLDGYGVAFGNAYMWGNIDQFDRPAFLVTQQLYQMTTTDTLEVVLANDDWMDDYNWDTNSQEPTPSAPYLYSYWLQTFSDNSTNVIGPSLSGYDNTLFTVVLNKDIISLALSDWFVDGDQTDDLDFDVDAKLLRGNEQIPVASASATSEIAGFSVDTPVSIDANNIAHFHLHITGFVPQQVENILAENNYVTFRLYADNTNYAEHTLAVVENRQGDTGEDGEAALLYTIDASRRTFSHTDNVGIDFRFYRTIGDDRDLYIGYPLLVQFDINGNIVGSPLIPLTVKSILDWRPRNDTVVKAELYLFTTHNDAVEYFGYLAGVYESYSAEPSAFLTVTLAEPIIEMKLSHDGTITYPVSAETRMPEESSYTVYARMYANSMKLTLTSLTCDLIYGSTTSGVQIAQLDGAPNENVDFETIENVAVDASTHIFRITASAVYGGKTYTLSKDVIFCAVSAGQSVQGEQGIQGCVIRLRGIWKNDERYVNQSDLEQEEIPVDQNGIRYIDVVQYTDNGTTKWYQRKQYDDGYVPGQSTNPTVSAYWAESNSFEFIATQLLLAQNANIKFGQGNQLLVMDNENHVVGGMSGLRNGNDAVRLWMGSETPTMAPFQVTHEGVMLAANFNVQFQDLSNCWSENEPQSSDWKEHYRRALNVSDIKDGKSVISGQGGTRQVQSRMYNILANFDLVQLPTDVSFVGTRVVLCNNDSVLGEGTVVVQENREGFFGATKLETGTRTNPVVSVPVTAIEFVGGVLEFLAVPGYSGGCQWALVSDAANVKYFNGEIQDFNPDEQE